MSKPTKTIFTITTVHVESDKAPFSSGCLAWYSNRDDALDDIEKNAGDMFEHYYTYLILEEVPEFQWPDAKVVAWFKWSLKAECWEECEMPSEYEGVVNWAIG